MREENGRSLIGSASDTPIVDPWAQPKEPPKKRRRSSTLGLVALGVVTVSVPLALVGFTVIHHGKLEQIPETISKMAMASSSICPSLRSAKVTETTWFMLPDASFVSAL